MAYHLSRHLEENSLKAETSAALIEALALSPLIRTSSSEVARRLRDSFHRLIVDFAAEDAQKTPLSLPLELCAFSACLRPALLAPTSGAPELLRRLHLGSSPEELRKLRDVVLGPSSRNLVLTQAQLRGDFAEARWSQELEALQARCVEWLSSNRVSQVIFHATTEVWHRWLRDTGPIGGLIERVIRNQGDASSVPAIREELDRWSDRAYVDRQLQKTDEELRKIGAKRRPISDRSITAVRNRCAEAVALVGEWLGLLESRPEDRDNWIAERVREYRRDLLTSVPLARDVIASESAAGRTLLGLPMTAAEQALLRSLDDLLKLLGSELSETDRFAPPHHRLNGDLLRISQVELDDRWEPIEPEGETLLQKIIDLIEAEYRPWKEVVEACWERNDFLNSERLLEMLDQGESLLSVKDAEVLRLENNRRLQEARRNLRDSKELMRGEIERARLKGLIDEHERLDLSSRLNVLDEVHSLHLGLDHVELTAIRDEFVRGKQQRISEFEKQLHGLGIATGNPGAYERVLRVLESEDLATAHEYLAIIERGGELPATEQSAPGFDYFGTHAAAETLDFFSQIEPLFFGKDRTNLREVSRRIQTRQPIGAIELSDRLTPGQAQQAWDVLDVWIRLKNGSGDERPTVHRVLDFLGFVVKQVREARDVSQGGRWFELEAETLESRNDCILPDFGSRCQGHYQIVCLEGQPLEEDILRAANPERRTQPVIAFFFGAMSSRRRRDLAHALRRRPRKLLVLDDVLLVYLCLQRRRLPAFLNAAGAFSVAEPYTNAAAQVPPEMFFGRAPEINSVFSPTGTSLVYGGRQLGKTVLLNEVRRRHHRPEQGTIVELIDLRHGEHLGLTRPLDDIWLIIAARLQPFGVVQLATRKEQTIGKEIARWLDQEHTRTIVLLLDEADIFLNIDGKEGWPRVGRMKTIMEETQRRFKVVFAGLHNVQRTSHDANTPLAHLGSPICVGPFLSDAEMRDATDMVTLPFRAMGYRFQAFDLAGRDPGPIELLSKPDPDWLPAAFEAALAPRSSRLRPGPDPSLRDRSGRHRERIRRHRGPQADPRTLPLDT